MDSKWFNQVLKNILNGQQSAGIKRLTDNQIKTFYRFVQSDRTDYNGRRSTYTSADSRYHVRIYQWKHYTELFVEDNFINKASKLIAEIEWLKGEIDQYGEDEQDIEDLAKLESELEKYSKILVAI